MTKGKSGVRKNPVEFTRGTYTPPRTRQINFRAYEKTKLPSLLCDKYRRTFKPFKTKFLPKQKSTYVNIITGRQGRDWLSLSLSTSNYERENVDVFCKITYEKE